MRRCERSFLLHWKERKRFAFNRIRLFYFKEKPTTPLHHGGKNIKKHMFQRKNLFIRKLLKHLWKRKKMGKSHTTSSTLGWKLQNYPCLYEKANKRYKERDMKNAWRTVEQFLIAFLWAIRDQAILWKDIHFSSLISLKS